MLHLDGRVIADGVPGGGEPPDQIDVLAVPQRLVESADRVDRCHSDDQRRRGDVGDPPTRRDERRSVAEVEGREGLLVRRESGVTGRRHDTGRHRRNGRIVEVPEQSVEPVGAGGIRLGIDGDIGVHEGNELGALGPGERKAVGPSHARTAADITPNHPDTIDRADRRARTVVDDDGRATTRREGGEGRFVPHGGDDGGVSVSGWRHQRMHRAGIEESPGKCRLCAGPYRSPVDPSIDRPGTGLAQAHHPER